MARCTTLTRLRCCKSRAFPYASTTIATSRTAHDAGKAGTEPDELADTASGAGASLDTAMSVYTDRSTAAGSTVTQSSADAPPSTLGGRGAARRGKQRNKRGRKVRQGAPDEEPSLLAHIVALAPTPALCTQVRLLMRIAAGKAWWHAQCLCAI